MGVNFYLDDKYYLFQYDDEVFCFQIGFTTFLELLKMFNGKDYPKITELKINFEYKDVWIPNDKKGIEGIMAPPGYMKKQLLLVNYEIKPPN